MRPSSENGGGSAVASTSTSHSPSSTSPVDSAGFSVPSGRCRTVPVNARARTRIAASAAPSTTHWMMPGVVAEVDEREVLAVLAPARHPAADA